MLNLQTKHNETNEFFSLFSSGCTRHQYSEQTSFLWKKEICKIVGYFRKS